VVGGTCVVGVCVVGVCVVGVCVVCVVGDTNGTFGLWFMWLVF